MTRSWATRRLIASSAALAASALIGAGAAAQGTPLFSNNTALQITIEAPFDTLLRTAQTSTDYAPGTLSLTGGHGGAPQSFPIRVQARGLTRRSAGVCRFPPLRVNFDRSERPLDGTVFAGQDRLKLVTHCQTSASYQQYYVLEYLAYRIQNELTPVSFRVRPLDVTYVDAEGRRSELTRFAFFIEDVDHAAQRNGYEEFEVQGGVADSQLDAQLGALAALFQYMIGNLDWDFAAGPAGEDCCHNSRLASRGGAATALAPLPYDFDYSGLVDASYAVPPPSMRVRSVTDRRYRGLCRFNSALPGAVERINARRAAILSLVENEPRLDTRTRRRALRYLQGFFEIMDDPRSFERSVVQACE